MAGARQAIFEQRKKTSQASRNDDCAGGADDRPVPLDAGNAGSEDETDAKQESGQVSIVAVEVDRHRRGAAGEHFRASDTAHSAPRPGPPRGERDRNTAGSGKRRQVSED